MSKKQATQTETIMRLLTRYKAVDAFKVMYYWRIMRLSAIIHRLRKEGWIIHTEMRENAKKNGQHALYKLISQPKTNNQ